MGILNLPDSGSVYVDANCVIYSVEKINPFASLLVPLWDAASTGRISILTSELTLLETLVKPLGDKNRLLEELFVSFLLNSREVRLISIHAEVLLQAARLRAAHSLKTPDAIHAATAMNSGCQLFVTNDERFKKVSALNVALLGD